MTYVITEPCIDVKHKTCVDVCPVSCIYLESDELDRMLYITPTSVLTAAPASLSARLMPSFNRRQCRRNGRSTST